MGPTLAGFATEAAAADYGARFGGRSLSPAEIDLELLASLSLGCFDPKGFARDHSHAIRLAGPGRGCEPGHVFPGRLPLD